MEELFVALLAPTLTALAKTLINQVLIKEINRACSAPSSAA